MIVDDVIAVRFLSKPFRDIENLRIGSQLIIPWLVEKQIQFNNAYASVSFTLPDKFKVLTHLSQHVFEALYPVELIFRVELLKLDAHYSGQVKKFSIPLDGAEILGVYSVTNKKLSFAKFSR